MLYQPMFMFSTSSSSDSGAFTLNYTGGGHFLKYTASGLEGSRVKRCLELKQTNKKALFYRKSLGYDGTS